MIARLRLAHWRYDAWPIWYPVSITEARNKGRKSWGDGRDSPVQIGMFLETMMRLQERGMTWQPVLHHRGRYYGLYRIKREMLDDFYDLGTRDNKISYAIDDLATYHLER